MLFFKRKKVLCKCEGWVNADSDIPVVRFTPAVSFEVTQPHKPINILRIRRVLDREPKNYWFDPKKKKLKYKKVRIIVEEV